jgi:translation initiation factor 3 subunit B
VVDGLPKVGQDKRAKLIAIIFKLYSQFASYLVEDADIHMPADESGMSMGFCFVKFRSGKDAQLAQEKTQGFALSKANTFTVSMYSDLDKYKSVDEVYEAPPTTEFVAPPNANSWLCDSQGRDQFVLRHGRDTEVFWANTALGEEPSKVYGGEREKEGGKVWCERHVLFSPQGTFLVTFHPQGIKLWGCDQFESKGRFLHQGVETMEFSPCERYIITYSSDGLENIIVWSVKTQSKLRAFPYKSATDVKMMVQATVQETTRGGRKVDGEAQVKTVERSFRGKVSAFANGMYSIAEGAVVHTNVHPDRVQALQNPNVMRWSHDGRYLARLGADAVSVYEVPSMQLLDKKSFAAKDMLNFCWSPRQNVLSYWSPTSGNYPAMVNIVSVERKEICSRKCFDVLEGHMSWQSEGEFLSVHMTKQQSKKRSYVVMFFRVGEPGVPVELIERAEPIVSVSWEPAGERVAIVSGEAKNATITFYSMSAPATKKGPGAKELTQLFELKGAQCTDVNWSPAGGICALAYFVSGDSCTFQLYDVDNNAALATRRHERCTGLHWDPSGRILASVTTSPMVNGTIIRGAPLQIEDSYSLWSFQGSPICVVRREKLYKFIWRPRPDRLMKLEERRSIVKNLKKYEKVFEREDKIRKAEIYQENTAKRNAIAADFLRLLAARKEDVARRFDGDRWRVMARDGYDEEDDSNYEVMVQTEEIILSTKEQIVSSH